MRVDYPQASRRVVAGGFCAAAEPAGRGREHTCVLGVGAAAGLVMRKIVSWLLRGGKWRRPQSKLNKAEPFDQDHRTAAVRTSPKRPWMEPVPSSDLASVRTRPDSASRRKQSGSEARRRRCARNPKWRMRTNPGGSACSRNQRRNSLTGSECSVEGDFVLRMQRFGHDKTAARKIACAMRVYRD